MRRQTFGRSGRRGTAITASAAVLCLGGALAGCGDRAGGDGYTAVGAAATGPAKAPSGAVAPSGKVTLVPLDGSGRPGGGGAGDSSGAPHTPSPGSSDAADGGTGGTGAAGGTAGPGASGSPADASGGTGGTATSGSPSNRAGSGPAGGSTGSAGSSDSDPDPEPGSGPASPSAPGSTAPAGPAVIEAGTPARAAADERWCEKVTVEFRNTGGSPARSGTVTFSTHIIGGLGIDWATRESTAPLPVPIGAGAARKMTYTVCVDAWRVPLGMHVETRGVTAVWK
ncbi:hypothetical protein [Streptomyces sp. NPDC091416]|uniref:hypothetical protein n=1 Tax=Streptomyces sp. NPDC091416 TaxID=3366003 RepID=UPI00383016CC